MTPFSAHRAMLDYTIEIFPAYKLQYLVPPENMAFAAWKKATYHYANQALQHKALFELWNGINFSIRNDAIKWSGIPRKIITGILKIPDNQITTWVKNNLYDIWITVITEFDEVNPTTSALVILMNNFINQPSNVNSQTADSSNLKSQSLHIDKLCGTGGSFCVRSLRQKFAKVGGEIRCCKLTIPIMKLFNINGLFALVLPDTLMKIENINVVPSVKSMNVMHIN
ncbi:uncharacterized protein LOC135837740 isoform X2 [Planococcus citri]|uniref:uncharacterized protein LOC135837740 isoform X2 n=1 Tax=Planococcus citri TaxID=170843 RepID=UPI0031F76E16